MKNEYEKQAQEFLTKTKTTLEIVEATEQTAPLWAKKGEKHGIKYSCTLKNSRSTYVFDFWDSIKNAEIIWSLGKLKISIMQDSDSIRAERILDNEGVKWHELRHSKDKREAMKKQFKPSAYDILACLSLLHEDTLEDFASSFGYDSDSITALRTFEACKEQDRQLRRLFSMEELELLTNIQ